MLRRPHCLLGCLQVAVDGKFRLDQLILDRADLLTFWRWGSCNVRLALKGFLRLQIRIRPKLLTALVRNLGMSMSKSKICSRTSEVSHGKLELNPLDVATSVTSH